ncbi:MAG TPA: alpha-N-arabinofuranosidase [Opitutaceae bacterium]|nr:alpha-N-arabinofuranosidase [Opitutaceae bacterium]
MRSKPLSMLAALVAAAVVPVASAADAQLIVDASKPGPVISKNIYGQFSEHLGHCIYEGIWVGPDSPIPNTKGFRNDVLAALKQLQVPQLRWPGGCFADEYHWRDGIGPREKRPSMFNSHWGGVVENNHFGTHEFLDLCELLGIEPYVCLNVGSGTVQEAMEWVEYMTSPADSPMANLRRANGRDKPWKVPYLAIGNESWGCGGNMRPEFCADNFRRYNTFVKNYADTKIQRIACGASGGDYDWTEKMMMIAGNQMNGLALHYYTLPTDDWKAKGASTGFGEDQYFSTLRNTLRMEELLTKHLAIMDKYDPEKKVGMVVDEWGIWTDVEPGTNPGFLFQQNTLRDALLAALNFNIFHAHADRVTMANIAQIVNVLQAMILTDKEKMIVTPTYHAFEMYKVFQGSTSIPVKLVTPDYVFKDEKIPAVSATAARAANGKVYIALVNVLPNETATITASLVGLAAKGATGRVLTAGAMDAHNTFAAPHTIEPAAFTGAKLVDGKLAVTLPAKSLVVLELQ